jgi:hypothetical protein
MHACCRRAPPGCWRSWLGRPEAEPSQQPSSSNRPRYEHTIMGPRPASIRLPTRGAPAFAGSIRILTRADPGAVFILITTAVVSAVIPVRSSCDRTSRRTVRGSSINASANRRARYRATGYRTISIAASCNSISPAGNADTTSMNRAATEMSAASVKASTAIATTTPTRKCVIRDEAGAD